MGSFKVGDWVEIEDIALGLKSIGYIEGFAQDNNYNLYYKIQWKINQCSKSTGIQPSSLYPVKDFDKKGRVSATGQVLYGTKV